MEIFVKIIISFIIFSFLYKYIKKNNILVFLTAIYFYKFYNLEISFIVIIEQLFLIIILYKILEILLKKNSIIYKIFNIDEIELIKNGRVDASALHFMDITMENLLNRLEYTNIEDILLCTIDNKKKLNIILKKNQTPIPIIINSVIEHKNLILIKKNIEWIKKILVKKKLSLNDIYYAFYFNGNFFIITYSDIDKEM